MSAYVVANVLGELGRGDEVAVDERRERGRRRLEPLGDGHLVAAAELATLVDELPDESRLTDEGVARVLDATSDAAEALLAVAFPVLEYGRGAAVDALPRALRHVALATSAARAEQTAPRIAAVAVVGRLVWALAAFALHCDRPQALVAVARARVTVPFTDGDVTPVMALTPLRYPDALGRDAGNSFRDYHDWLRGLALLDRYPLFRDEFDVAFREGDLVIAMYAGRFRTRVYATGRERDAVRRFAARVDVAAQRQGVDALFYGDGELKARLEAAYAATEGGGNGFERGPDRLFGGE